MGKFLNMAVKYKFTPKELLSKAAKAEKQVLMGQGAYVRKAAMSSIKKAGKKRRSSKPGHPPYSQTGLLRKFILFHVDEDAHNVIVGPKLLSQGKHNIDGGRTIPEILERGGSMRRIVKYKATKRKPATTRRVRVRIKARPYMMPAYHKGLKDFARKFEGTIT